MKSYVVKTLGCKANLYDSQLMEEELQKRGWVPAPPEGSAALCIVNSCTVTDEADRQTRRMASRFFRDHPDSCVVVTGCGAEVDPERLATTRGVRYVIGNRDKPDLVNLILERLRLDQGRKGDPDSGTLLGSTIGYTEILSRHPMDREWPLAESAFQLPPVQLNGNSGTTRAFLKIQEGCNSFCTYCIIPYGRGPGRSLSPREVLKQVQALVDQGIREIVITGTNVGDYGSDWGADPATALVDLFSLILKESDLERLRVSSLDPTEITPGLMDLMASNSRFCPHFHVSLQSADSRILKLMKRKYGTAEVRDCLERIATIPAPLGGVFVGMDVITGFPGETEEEFDRSVELLAELPWSRLHVFPYSEREGTPATRLPGAVPQSRRVERARILNHLSVKRMTAIHERVLSVHTERGSLLEGVLLEKPVRIGGIPHRVGYSPNYLRVVLENAEGEGRGPGRNETVHVRPLSVSVDLASQDVSLRAVAIATDATH